MNVVRFKQVEDLSEHLAEKLSEAIKLNPEIVLGLATGRTFIPVYRSLVNTIRDKEISVGKVVTFNLDEYVGVRPAHRSSFSFYMYEHLWSQLDFSEARTHIPSGTSVDLAGEGKSYEKKIQMAGGIDIQLLGLGLNGHIGFNEPGSSFASATRVVDLAPKTKEQNAQDFENGSVPDRAMTMGLSTIMKSKQIYLVVTGKEKATILARSFEERSEAVPASILIDHPNCTVLADEEAAALLKK